MEHLDRARLAAVVVLTIAVDAITKIAAVEALADGRVVDLGILDLRLVHNTGVAFSMGADQPVGVVVAFTGLMMLGFSVAAWRGHLGGALPAGLVVGGGLGNLIDRAIRGSVVDMFDVGFWPVFNVADVALTVGIGMLILTAFGDEDEAEEDDREVAAVA